VTRLRVLGSRLRALVRSRQMDRDLEDEIAGHLAEATDEYVRQGLSPADARLAALRRFGGVAQARDVHRDVRSFMWLDDAWQDLRYTGRLLIKQRAFTIVVVLTLALGIGAGTAIFTLLDAVVFKPLPVPAAGELLTLYENGPEGQADPAGGTGRFLRFSHPRFERLREALGSDGSLAAVTRNARFVARPANATEPHFLKAQLVSGEYFATLRVSAARGRVLTSHDVDAAAPVAVVSQSYWKRLLGGNDAAIGQTLAINGVSVSVVGITPPGFFGIWTDSEADVWLPLTLQPTLRYSNNSSGYGAILGDSWIAQDVVAWLNLVARVEAANLPRATSKLEAANRQGTAALAAGIDDPERRKNMLAHSLAIEPLSRGFSGLRARFSDALFVLSGMVTLVLVVTCANIANLLLARAAWRAREVDIRVSLGATAGRLVRQSLTESVTLALLGGAAGVLLGTWGSRVLAREVFGGSGELPVVFSPDTRILAVAAGVSFVTGVVFGLAPALRAVAAGRGSALGTNQRQAVGATTIRGTRLLVVSQLALSVVIVFAAVLLGRTLLNFMRVDPGFSPDRLVIASFDAVVSGYPADGMPQLAERLIEAARSVPGVESAAVSRCGLVAGCSSSGGLSVEGLTTSAPLNQNWISASYFQTAGIPFVSGRPFDERDTARGVRVAIVNESVARRYFSGVNPLGRRIGSSSLDTEIVGVVRDARTQTLHRPPVPMVYFPLAQRDVGLQTAPTNMDVRVAGNARIAAHEIREAIRRAEPNLLVDEVAPMSHRLARDLNSERLVAWLALGFAVLALLLASLGLYGLLSYNVARRTQEIGVRMALGARRSVVMGLILGQSARLACVGLFVGLIGAAAGTRYLSGLLYGVTPLDPSALALVSLVFVLVTMLASYVPARRATSIDPLASLRSE
jgi:predicted permease